MGKFLDLTGLGYFKNKLDQVKADKDTDAVEGNLAEFDANGNPVDSGVPTTKIGEIEEEVSVLRNSAGIAEGIADTISAGTPQEFVFRQSGGDGVNYMKRIKGKSLVWNQLVQNGNFAEDANWSVLPGATKTISGGTLKVDLTGGGDVGCFQFLPNSINGHKIYYAFEVVAITTQMYCGIARGDASNPMVSNIATQLITSTGRKSFVVTPDLGAYSKFGFVFSRGGAGTSITVKNAICIDLTLMFGSGNEPSTVEEFKALYPEAYYAYNAGSVESNDAEAIETVGRNLWDGTITATGKYININGASATGADYDTSDFIPILPNREYYLKNLVGPAASSPAIVWYNKDKQLISGLSGAGNLYNKVVTSPAGAAYLKCSLYTPTIDDICINLSDASFNGQYEPHWKRTLNLGLKAFKVTDGTNIITVNSLKSAGSVYDEIDFARKKYIKRVGEVDLGDLTYTYNYTVPIFYTASNYRPEAQCICSKYPISNEHSAASRQEDKSVSIYDSGRLYIKDTAYSDAETFKAAMSGVMLYYELATPIEYDLVDDIPNAILIDSYGTEKAIFPEHEDGSPSAPFCCDSNYSISVKNLMAFINAQNNG